MDYKALAQKYGTPLYVYDFDEVSRNYNKIKTAFKARKSIIAYAVKANSNLSLLKHLANLGSGADCVSIGEIKRALLAGIPNYKIIFSGVGKRDDEIAEALEKDILFINIESEAELFRVEEIAAKLGKQARISVRVNPNIDPLTHPYISTGLSENKFGVAIDTAKKLYLKAKNSPYLNPVGIHFHIGSQLTELAPIKEASAIVADLTRALQKIDIDIKFFDVGGGLGIRYKDEKTIEPYDYAQAILATLSGTDMTIICEPGRFIVGNAGVFLTSVLYEKETGSKRFIIVDGGMNDLLRPSLYNAYHEVEVVGKSENASLADVVGPVCESGDFFAKDRLLPKTEHGDIVVVKSAGAYGFVMSSNYNTRPRPAEVAIEGEEDRLIRERESFEYLIEKEVRFMV
ncbi:diaminopimelate decarboxylase [Nitratiruptor sp. YY08-26]|uniref:diaminopimelate decarboxylase n=1 Tax=unclassified Nitratiruptor TaxID=2624044 RepID=UPI00191628DC|nr:MULTISPECIES: diaminopimelate decarboxylase [unclassified Nitratiruptor]BCD61571.1 diaminopimelate decarboxylase [Nitratiruptor sp. YY08-13]BCD65505.1 diaminopimelate decarboxylase [Nitratiruptor sp. YY08-26]